ncbi:MAG: HD domain-containing protein [Parachlamydia sp.]|jgi:putative hydrolase of HD superfamily|nr:HD domain-containing protein [Parachlamydia sp.]
MREIVNLLNEVGMLAHVQRSGLSFLGSGKQSVAEHSYRVALIAYALARLSKETIDLNKLTMICLFHDLPEARIGDLNYVQKKYVEPKLTEALHDLACGSSLGPEIVSWIEEYEKESSFEAILAHDADQLELLLLLKREEELGNVKAAAWSHNAKKRLKTPIALELAQAIMETPSDSWWLGDPDDPHWIDGGKNQKKINPSSI